MDVTKVNFELVTDEFVRLLNECDFYTVDQEMTGINIPGMVDNCGLTMEESYVMKKAVAEKYLAFQFGVCLFTQKKRASKRGRVGEDGEVVSTTGLPKGFGTLGCSGGTSTPGTPASPDPSPAATPQPASLSLFDVAAGGGRFLPDAPVFEVRPFNFWLRCGQDGEDVAFSMSATDFHVKNRLNLNKWVTEGIPFATSEKETEVRNAFFPPEPERSSLSPEELRWVDMMLDKIRHWVEEEKAKPLPVASEGASGSPATGTTTEEKPAPKKGTGKKDSAGSEEGSPKLSSKSGVNSSDPTLLLPFPATESEAHVSLNADLSLHYHLQRSDLNVMFDPPLDTGYPLWRRSQQQSKVLWIRSPAEWRRLQNAETYRREQIVRRKIGFRYIWKALCESKKLHVGHNYFSDILFAMQIHESKLPDSLEVHRQRVSRCFPFLLDTKVLVQALDDNEETKFDSSALENACLEAERRLYRSTFGDNFALLPNGDKVRDIQTYFPLGFEKYAKSAIKIAESCNSDAVVAHHAAYDAYMTGMLLLRLSALYGTPGKTAGDAPTVDPQLTLSGPLFQRWLNHIAVFGSVYYWRTDAGFDPETGRPIVCYANCTPIFLKYPPQLSRQDLEPLFYTEKELIIFNDWLQEKKKAEKVKARPPPLNLPYRVSFLTDSTAVLTRTPPEPLDELLARGQKGLEKAKAATVPVEPQTPAVPKDGDSSTAEGTDANPAAAVPTAKAKLMEHVRFVPFEDRRDLA